MLSGGDPAQARDHIRGHRPRRWATATSPTDVAEQVELEIKYSGYIDRQEIQVAQASSMEEERYPTISTTPRFARYRAKPRRSCARKARDARPGIPHPGVTPADVAILTVFVQSLRAKIGTGRQG